MKKLHTIIAGALVAALTFTSCTTVNPYTGQQQTSKTLQGGAVGALSGALIGAMAGDRRDALKGAAIGGIVGGGIGAYRDSQEAEVRRQLYGTGVSVTRSGNDLILNMPSDITFRTGSSSIQPKFTRTLNAVALVLKKFNRTKISIAGHTDSVGGTSYNKNLSISRARSVARVINARGVAGYRLLTYGYGESRPIASNATRSGKAKNRRVELRIIPQRSRF